jgi:hypothetical protein
MTPTEIRVIRGCAIFDLVVTGLLALPATAGVFIDVLYLVNGWFGGDAVPPPFVAVQWMFVHLAGALGVLWAVARIAQPTRFLGLADAVGRACVGGLILWHVTAGGAPGVLLAFVLSEWLGTVLQWLVLRRAAP